MNALDERNVPKAYAYAAALWNAAERSEAGSAESAVCE